MSGLHTKLTLDQHRSHLGSVQMQLAAERDYNRALSVFSMLAILGLIGIIAWQGMRGACS